MTTANASPNAPPQGRRERRKAATRNELIIAGIRLFGANGLYEARIEDLTTTAGIAKGTLYTYFTNKNELIRAVASMGFAQLGQHVVDNVRKAHDDEALLRQVVQAHLSFFAEHPDLMRVFHQLRGMLKFDRPTWRPLRTALVAYLSRLAAILGTAPRAARMSDAERYELASVVFGAISGVTSVWMATGHFTARSRSAKTLVAGLAAMATDFISTRSPAGSAGTSRRQRARPRSGR